MRNRVAFGLVALLVSAGCTANTFTGPGTDDAGKPPPVGGGGDGGAEGGQSDAAVPPGCDKTKLPTDDKCVINDGEAIFVSASTGSANGDGTQAKPMSSLDVGIAAAKQAGKRVYACAETYNEAITLKDGVDVFGYFDCSNGWSVSTSHAKVAPAVSPAAHATDVTNATRIEAVDFIAPDFTTDSQSSIALIARNASGLHFIHNAFHAGTGGKGADGTAGIQLTDSSLSKNGMNSWAAALCTSMTLFCNLKYGGTTGGTTTCIGASGHDPAPGGTGGAAGHYHSLDGISWYAVSATTAGNPTSGNAQTNQGGAIGLGGSFGGAGAKGADGQMGGAVGSFTANGYSASDGTTGVDGQPGQSGGGSGGWYVQNQDVTPSSNADAWGESGGGGGAGGCPGLAAQPGLGGGASIALIAVASPLTLEDVVVETSVGGAGGAAGKPSQPTGGGSGGIPAKHTVAGGNGGMGGRAGVSGNGGGGPSIAIAYQGTMPQLLATTLTPGAAGSGVAPRVCIDGTIIPASPDGLSKDRYAF